MWRQHIWDNECGDSRPRLSVEQGSTTLNRHGYIVDTLRIAAKSGHAVQFGLTT